MFDHVSESVILCRQAEYLYEIALVYENIFGINQWWIGLSDLGNLHVSVCLMNLKKIKWSFCYESNFILYRDVWLSW
jgi:hypothetical protein